MIKILSPAREIPPIKEKFSESSSCSFERHNIFPVSIDLSKHKIHYHNNKLRFRQKTGGGIYWRFLKFRAPNFMRFNNFSFGLLLK